MLRLAVVHALDDTGAALLRDVLDDHPEPDARLSRWRADVATGAASAVALLDAGGAWRGIALWRARDAGTQVQIEALTLAPDTPAAAAEALVERVLRTIQLAPALQAIEVFMRGAPASIRAALARRSFAFFERCLMIRPLDLPVPPAAAPPGYRVETWSDAHQPAVEVTARMGQAGSIDAVAVPEGQSDRIGEVLRALRAGTYPGLDAWNDAASLVVLAPDDTVAGYIAVVVARGMPYVADLLVHPAHRRRGLARLLMTRSLAICREQGAAQCGLAVTTLNPARALYERLGFTAVECGESAIWWRDGRQLPWAGNPV